MGLTEWLDSVDEARAADTRERATLYTSKLTPTGRQPVEIPVIVEQQQGES